MSALLSSDDRTHLPVHSDRAHYSALWLAAAEAFSRLSLIASILTQHCGAGEVVVAALPFYRVQFIAYLMHDL
jgi:hypothetical protein